MKTIFGYPIMGLICFAFFACNPTTPPQKKPATSASAVVNQHGNIKIELKANNPAAKFGTYALTAYYKPAQGAFDTVLTINPIGCTFEGHNVANKLQLTQSQQTPWQTSYSLPHGKRKNRQNEGNQAVFTFATPNADTLHLQVLATNDGVAFRYRINQLGQLTNAKQLTDAATFSFAPGTKSWLQKYIKDYEDFYLNQHADTVTEFGFPGLFQTPNQQWALITETNVDSNNCGWHLLQNKPNTYSLALPQFHGFYKEAGINPTVTFPWVSPWRVCVLGGLKNIVETTLVEDLAAPSQIAQTDWIQPGPVSWVYWAHNHGSKDFKVVKKYIELAHTMQWPYVLIDWEWDQMGNGGNIQDALALANSKGIKPLLWYNSGSSWLGATPIDRMLTDSARQKEMKWLQSVGCKGIKVDFFAGDLQPMMRFITRILSDAAQHKLMVNLHGSPLPRGMARTWPNLMTSEGVFGAEMYNNDSLLTPRAARHNATLPFTRNVVGSMDYTPVTFTNSQHPHITTNAHEMALSIVFESAWQHLADRPAGFLNRQPQVKYFFSNLPTAFDQTLFVSGYPGESVVLARRSGKRWYIAGLNGTATVKNFAIDVSALPISPGSNLLVYTDGAKPSEIQFKATQCPQNQTITVKTLARGGFVVLYEP